MADREITLWLDERWYAALQSHFREETLQDKLMEYLDGLINRHIPEREYEQISKEIYEEQMELKARRKAERRFSVFRVFEDGSCNCFQLNDPADLLVAARSVRNFVRTDPGYGFANYYHGSQPITLREFDECIKEYQNGSINVVGAFDIDFDNGTFAYLEREGDWKVYAIKDISAAAYHADRKNYERSSERLKHIHEHLAGKELPQQVIYRKGYLIYGERELKADDVSFSGEVIRDGEQLDFYLDSFPDLGEVLGTEVCAAEGDDYVNLYADYDLERKAVSDTLLVILHRCDGANEQFEYPLSPREQKLLLMKMQEYCDDLDFAQQPMESQLDQGGLTAPSM